MNSDFTSSQRGLLGGRSRHPMQSPPRLIHVWRIS